jgi:hypothetical protein
LGFLLATAGSRGGVRLGSDDFTKLVELRVEVGFGSGALVGFLLELANEVGLLGDFRLERLEL